MIVPLGSMDGQLKRLKGIVKKQYGWEINTEHLSADILNGSNELHLIDKDLVLFERQYLPNSEATIVMCVVTPQSGADITDLLTTTARKFNAKYIGNYIPTINGCNVEIQEIV